MALKSTIFKFNIAISDLDREYYDSLELTVAQHPSESAERMMARVLAYCINAQEFLTFTTGLSTPDEPDIWAKSLDDRLLLWLDVGEPSHERIKKATRAAETVKVYSFNRKSDVWWRQESSAFSSLNVDIFQFDWHSIQSLAALLTKKMALSMTITANTAYIALDTNEVEVSWQQLQQMNIEG